MINKNTPYKNIFLYASLQFCGHIDEYFINYTEKLVVFIVMPRIKSKNNLIRVYNNGRLVEEVKVTSSENIFLYYGYWYLHHMFAVYKYFNRRERVTVISFHPLTFFFMGIQRIFRKIEYVYWIGDYFPGVSFSLIVYEKIKRFYHNRIKYACYLSDRINEKMNGIILSTTERKTVMWGVKPEKISKKHSSPLFSLLFIGLIKPSQGIENILFFLKTHKTYSINILGICEESLYQKYQDMIKKYNIESRVFFPNYFFSDEEVKKYASSSHAGIAMYDEDPTNATHFADPGKVKTYAELGLPIIMSNVSDIAGFVKEFHCGEIVTKTNTIEAACGKIKKNYKDYENGVRKFNEYFYYENYYKDKFAFLEQV